MKKSSARAPVKPALSKPKTNLLGLSRAGLEQFFLDQGEQRFRAEQILKWIHQQGVMDFAAMTNLSMALREKLETIAKITLPEVAGEQLSTDGTRKWLLRVDPQNSIEMVFIPENGRGTLCVSSQAGCALNCAFCATAKQGFGRNLSSAEIIGQLWLARQLLAETAEAPKITNMVLMGMGEPLLNFEAVARALELMIDDCAWGLAKRRVTVSTAGLVAGIKQLAERCPVSLAVSLHAPDDALRDQLVPINRSYPIKQLLNACREYVADDRRAKITFEYVMLDGVNDSAPQAKALARLLQGIPSKVNLIPFNPFPGTEFRCSSQANIDRFREILSASGLTTITRRPRGQDIAAACGRLEGDILPRSQRIARLRTAQTRHHPAPGVIA